MLGLILSLVRSIRKGGGESSAAATGGGESAAGGGESRADGNGGGGGGEGPEAAGEIVRDGRSGFGLGVVPVVSRESAETHQEWNNRCGALVYGTEPRIGDIKQRKDSLLDRRKCT
ncbi:hypothetical protein Fcan01_15881 [Folsomia candida]|uniref:Uncharacterized protein n=1 Tax=Folsomia candida TaxID=158441 RepID=A0A226DWG3_FOLCA|nr:hypothetical protein Fcan01_15881 [Folsomia candida]